MSVSGSIPKYEIVTYFIIWAGAVLYSIYCFAKETSIYFQDYQDDYKDFSSGWSFLSRKRDSSDNEWESFKNLIIELIFPLILSTVVSEILRRFNYVTTLILWRIFISTYFIVSFLGLFPLAILIIQPLFFALILQSKNVYAVWLCNIVSLSLLTISHKCLGREEILKMAQLQHREIYLTMVAAFWTNMRCVSYCLDVIKHSECPNIINLLAYCFYLPLLIGGPFICYKDFRKNDSNLNSGLSERFVNLIHNICRIGFWFWLNDFILHFVYVHAITYHPKLIDTLSSWSFYGYGYTLGQMFQLKYVVLYGFSTAFAQFEQIKVPTSPICIGRVHLYSDLWKYFDPGLHSFLLQYIYIPTMRRREIYNRLLSSFLCFFYVYIWHGTDYYIFIWAVLNYIGIVIETLSKTFNERYLEKSTLSIKLGPSWMRRMNCVCASPLLAMSAISNFYFLAQTSVGNLFTWKLIYGNFQTNFILFTILYCCCQVSTELRSNNNKIKSK